MHLSEAIRAGVRFGGNEVRRRYRWFDKDGNLCGCALGAALFAIGYTDENFDLSKLEVEFPILSRRVVPPWAVSVPPPRLPMESTIHGLFENDRWTKAAISEWVEVQERKLGLWDEPSEAVKEAAPEPCETKERVKV